MSSNERYKMKLSGTLGELDPSLQNFWKRDMPKYFNTFHSNMEVLRKDYGVSVCEEAVDTIYIVFPSSESYVRFKLKWM